jgi:hypothetical protein
MDAAKNFLDATEERADLNQSFGILWLRHCETGYIPLLALCIPLFIYR